MSVVIFSFEGKGRLGGVARLCAEIGHALRRAGYEVALPLDEERNAGEDAPVVTNRQTPPLHRLARAVLLLRRAGRGHAVICSQWYPEGVLALLAGIRPTVTLAHGSELMPSRARWRRRLWRWLRGRVFSSTGTVVCSSAYSRDLLLRSHPTANAVALPLAVDHDAFTPGDREHARAHFGITTPCVVSSVSRLYDYKGHETVFRALAALSDDARGRFTYLIAGTGPERELLEQKAATFGVDRLVRWLGYVSDEELPLVYRASNLFVLTPREDASRQEVEGFGLVFLEAQACGTPVVGSRTGGIPDAVEEGNGGWLIDQGDADALSRILFDLDADPDTFTSMGQRARRRVETTATWAAYGERFIAATGVERFLRSSNAQPENALPVAPFQTLK